MRKLLVLCLLATALLAVPAFAQTVAPEYPWHDFKHRLTVGATGRYQWNAQLDTEEVVTGPVLAYELTRHLTLVGNVLYGFDTKHTVVQIGLTIPLFGAE